MNKVAGSYWDKNSRLGRIDLERGDSFEVFKSRGNWNEKNCSYDLDFVIRVAYDWNPSAKFYIAARTMRGLEGKIEREKYRLVKGK